MKKHFITAVLMGMVLAVYAQTGIIKSVTGTVEIKPAGAAAFVPAHAGDSIKHNTILSTGFKSAATIEAGSSVIIARPLTRLTLAEIIKKNDSETINVNLQAGRVRVDVHPQAGAKINFEMKSPVATASVRGTEFDLDTNELSVIRGAVAYETAYGPAIMVGQGGKSNAASGYPSDPLENAKQLLPPSDAAQSRRSAPNTDNAALIITLNGGGHAAEGVSYSVELKGPGGVIRQTLRGTATVNVAPGKWDIQVNAKDPAGKLRQRGGKYGIQASPGGKTPITIDMVQAAEAADWATLASLVQAAQNSQTAKLIIVAAKNLLANSTVTVKRASAPTLEIAIEAGSAGAVISRAPGFSGALFSVENNAALRLSNITAAGSANAARPLIEVVSAGTGRLILESGSVLRDNKMTGAGAKGGAVYVNGGAFTMNGSSEVSGNKADSTIAPASGGGIYIGAGSSFSLDGGRITGNTASSAFGNVRGGGIYLAGGGLVGAVEISGNDAFSTVGTIYVHGGGVYGTVALSFSGTAITNNKVRTNTIANAAGGGVYTASPSTFSGVTWGGNKTETLAGANAVDSDRYP